MPYNRDYNILYLHAPRMEEASVQDYFSRTLKVWSTNEEPQTLQTFRTDINAYTFIFGSVRNPYFRTVHDLYSHHVINREMRSEEVEGLLLAFLTQYDPVKNPNHITPQYMSFTNEGVIDPNVKIVKHETLEQDMVAIGFDHFKLKKHKCTDSYSQLTLKSIMAINAVYAKDFEHFGYEMITTQDKLDSIYPPKSGRKRDPPRSDPPRSDPPRSDPPRSDPPRSDPPRKTPTLRLNFYR